MPQLTPEQADALAVTMAFLEEVADQYDEGEAPEDVEMEDETGEDVDDETVDKGAPAGEDAEDQIEDDSEIESQGEVTGQETQKSGLDALMKLRKSLNGRKKAKKQKRAKQLVQSGIAPEVLQAITANAQTTNKMSKGVETKIDKLTHGIEALMAFTGMDDAVKKAEEAEKKKKAANPTFNDPNQTVAVLKQLAELGLLNTGGGNGNRGGGYNGVLRNGGNQPIFRNREIWWDEDDDYNPSDLAQVAQGVVLQKASEPERRIGKILEKIGA